MISVRSGDDHDYCEHVHEIEVGKGTIRRIREISVKSISMVMNVRRPGFQLLSLFPANLRQEGNPTHADNPCVLPDQIKIYLERYLPLIAMSLLIVFTSNVISWRRLPPPGGSSPQVLFSTRTDDDMIELDEESNSPSTLSSSVCLPGSTEPMKTSSQSSLRMNGWTMFDASGGAENNSLLSKLFNGLWVCSSSTVVHRRRRLWYRCLCDIRNIALVPLCIFAVINWWVAR